MTQREAHRWLKEEQRMMTQYRHLFSSEDIEANGMAILALERQIPKKPTQDLRKGLECYCPICGACVGWRDALASDLANFVPIADRQSCRGRMGNDTERSTSHLK